jgi:hypothetical protein
VIGKQQDVTETAARTVSGSKDGQRQQDLTVNGSKQCKEDQKQRPA